MFAIVWGINRFQFREIIGRVEFELISSCKFDTWVNVYSSMLYERHWKDEEKRELRIGIVSKLPTPLKQFLSTLFDSDNLEAKCSYAANYVKLKV